MSFFKSEEIQLHKKKINKDDLNKYLLDEKSLKNILSSKKNVLLVEPNYKRKYIPLGLAKISSYIKQNNGKTTFARNYIKNQKFDCVCITSLFTYDSEIVLRAIDRCRSYYKNVPIIVGGIYASLMPDHLLSNVQSDKNIYIFRGCSDFLDNTAADYSVDWNLQVPWNDFSFCFTTRGCPNKCGYCAVWRIEPEKIIIKNWKEQIVDSKANVMISDNNLSAQSKKHISNVLDFLIEINKHVVFDNGVDCKLVDDFFAQKISKIKFYKTGMRLAFDRIEEDVVFQNAIERLLKAGVHKGNVMAYVLFNFNDSPKEADYRARECVKLGIRPYPQRYTPLNYSSRKNISFIGKKWSEELVKAFRHFWLMGGLFRKMEFKDYIQTKNQFNITDKDIDLYNSN